MLQQASLAYAKSDLIGSGQESHYTIHTYR